MTDSFMVTLDRRYYKSKPSAEIGAITRRLQQAGPSVVTREQFAEHVRRGGTWVPGCYEPKRDGWGAFKSLQVVAGDIDNSTAVLDAEGKPVVDAEGHAVKRMLLPGEAGYLSMADALRLCEIRGLHPLMLYTTFSHSDEWPRFRVVFDLGEPIADKECAQEFVGQLMELFNGAADPKCSNLNRLYFGSTEHGVKEAWRSWQVSGDGN